MRTNRNGLVPMADPLHPTLLAKRRPPQAAAGAVRASAAAPARRAGRKPTGAELDALVSAAVQRRIAPVQRQVEAAAADLAAQRTTQVHAARDRVIGDAVAAGRIPATDWARWAADYVAAPSTVTRVLAAMPAGRHRTAADDEGDRLNAALFGGPDLSADDEQADLLNATLFGG